MTIEEMPDRVVAIQGDLVKLMEDTKTAYLKDTVAEGDLWVTVRRLWSAYDALDQLVPADYYVV